MKLGVDRRLSDTVRRLPSSWRPLMELLTLLGEPLTVIAAGVGGYIAAGARHQDKAQQAFVYALAAFFLGVLLKRLIHRSRPDHITLKSFGLSSYSFPSGHAFGSVIFYGLFAIISTRHLSTPWDVLWAAAIWLVIAGIGVSRVYLGSHYPTDVIGGWIFGGLALAFIVQTTL